MDVRLGKTLPEQPRRERLHPHSDDGRFARRGVRRDQVARDTHGGLRRSGLHRHPSGDPPRGAGAVRERRVGCRLEFLPSDSFGGRGETRGRLFVSHDSLHGECHGLVEPFLAPTSGSSPRSTVPSSNSSKIQCLSIMTVGFREHIPRRGRAYSPMSI